MRGKVQVQIKPWIGIFVALGPRDSAAHRFYIDYISIYLCSSLTPTLTISPFATPTATSTMVPTLTQTLSVACESSRKVFIPGQVDALRNPVGIRQCCGRWFWQDIDLGWMPMPPTQALTRRWGWRCGSAGVPVVHLRRVQPPLWYGVQWHAFLLTGFWDEDQTPPHLATPRRQG